MFLITDRRKKYVRRKVDYKRFGKEHKQEMRRLLSVSPRFTLSHRFPLLSKSNIYAVRSAGGRFPYERQYVKQQTCRSDMHSQLSPKYQNKKTYHLENDSSMPLLSSEAKLLNDSTFLYSKTDEVRESKLGHVLQKMNDLHRQTIKYHGRKGQQRLYSTENKQQEEKKMSTKLWRRILSIPSSFILDLIFLSKKSDRKKRTKKWKMLIFICRIYLLYLICFYGIISPYHQHFDNPNSSFYHPTIAHSCSSIVKWLEGTQRFLRTMKTVLTVGLDYKITQNWTYTPEEYESNEEARSNLHRRNAERFLHLFMKNGGIYIKVGQYLGSLIGVIPVEYCEVLSVCQDQAPFVSFEEVEKLFKEEFGKSIGETFLEFSREPIAAASLAQVHRAVTKDNKEVAVKVQYPMVRFNFDGDMFAHDTVIQLIRIFFRGLDFDIFGKDMKLYLATELDFVNEANNGRRAMRNFQHRDDVHIPNIFSEYSSDRVLTTEFIHGVKITDMQGMKRLGIRVDQAMQSMMEAFAEQIFLHGFVHTDPHPGNVFVRPNPNNPSRAQVVILDHGLYKELTDDFRRSFCQLWRSLVLRDELKLKHYCDRLGIEDPSYFASIVLMTSYDHSTIGFSSGMSLQDVEEFKKKLQRKVDDMMDILKKLPKEMLLVMRNNNLIRSINQQLGVPVNRFIIFARTADRGVHLIEESEYNKRQTVSLEDIDKLRERPIKFVNERDQDHKKHKSLSTLLKSWKDSLSFEFKIRVYEWKMWLVSWYFKIAIGLGFLQPINLDDEIKIG